MAALAPNQLDRLDVGRVVSLPHTPDLVVAIGGEARAPDLVVTDGGRRQREHGARSPGEGVVPAEVTTGGGGGRRRGSVKEISSGFPPGTLA
uniref:Uncharacterized protein n=1 Tax=Oryza meridionalis TaxID=40149 RepID=A0A0E0CV52_9ORYZ